MVGAIRTIRATTTPTVGGSVARCAHDADTRLALIATAEKLARQIRVILFREITQPSGVSV
jgi:hypothetical protein